MLIFSQSVIFCYYKVFFFKFFISKLSWMKISRVPPWHPWGIYSRGQKQNGRHRYLFWTISLLLSHLETWFQCLSLGFQGQGVHLWWNKNRMNNTNIRFPDAATMEMLIDAGLALIFHITISCMILINFPLFSEKGNLPADITIYYNTIYFLYLL